MSISYAPTSWNPAVGCEPVSEGCKNCWASKLHTQRFEAYWRNVGSLPEQYAEPFDKIQLLPDRLDQPLRWRKPRSVAVCFMGDLFHEQVPDEFIDHVVAVMTATARHTFLVLTKRPERMRAYFDGGWGLDCMWPAPNVWLGVTAENQHWADERIPLLLGTPAAHRWVSLEPLLGPVDLTSVDCNDVLSPATDDFWDGWEEMRPAHLDWVVVGGESGPGHRPMELGWAKDILIQCLAAGVPCYMKQAAGNRPGQPFGDLKLDDTKALPWN